MKPKKLCIARQVYVLQLLELFSYVIYHWLCVTEFWHNTSLWYYCEGKRSECSQLETNLDKCIFVTGVLSWTDLKSTKCRVRSIYMSEQVNILLYTSLALTSKPPFVAPWYTWLLCHNRLGYSAHGTPEGKKKSMLFFSPWEEQLPFSSIQSGLFPPKHILMMPMLFFLHNKTKPTHAHPMMIILVSRIYKGGKRGLWTLIRVRSPSKNAGIFYCHSSNQASLRNCGVVVFQGLSNDSSSFLTVLLDTL